MSKNPSAKERSHIDVHVGKQLARARTAKRMSQSEVARMLGLTFQQIQKYEKGTNRMSASVIWTLSDAMNLPVSFFFTGLKDGEDVQDNVLASLGRHGAKMAEVFADLTSSQQLLLIELALEMSAKKIPA